MKKVLIILLAVLSIGQVFAQTDRHGNPIVNSIYMDEKAVDDFLFISNYYTLRNNIENKQSSVFIAEKPSLDQIENAALSLASDFFIVTKESKIVVMVILHNEPQWGFMSIVMSSREQLFSPCSLVGDITENRAQEIISAQYDPHAVIEKNILHFNGKTFKIISNQEIEAAVLRLIKEEQLDKKKTSVVTIFSKKEMSNLILTETKEGGDLDFFTEIKGKENDGVQIKEGIFATRHGVALYKWGSACFEIGVNTVEDAYDIFSEFKQRDLNERETAYIKMGFDRILEQ